MQSRQPLVQLLQRLAAELCTASVSTAPAAERAAAKCVAGAAEGQLPRLLRTAADAGCPETCSALSAVGRTPGGTAAGYQCRALGRAQAAAMPQLSAGHLRHLHTSVQAPAKHELTAKAALVDGKPVRKRRSPRKPSKAAAEVAGSDQAAAKPKARRSRKRTVAAASLEAEPRSTDVAAGKAATAGSRRPPGAGARAKAAGPVAQTILPSDTVADTGDYVAPSPHGPHAAHAVRPHKQQTKSLADGGLSETQSKAQLTDAQRRSVLAAVRTFLDSADTQDQALALYLNAKMYQRAATSYRRGFLNQLTEGLRDALLAAPDEAAVQQLLFPDFARFALASFADEISAYRELVKTADLTNPHLWYPMARAIKRRIIYHAGPTNSGKTYQALQAMRGAAEGLYCAPLRLLAMEVADTCNAGGTFCSLITGQERQEVPGAGHLACTIEMADLRRQVDVAVIDEIQMVGDESRGWAWTRALQGLPASELHLCGDASALPLVRQLCADMGEGLEVRAYQRFAPLEVEAAGLRGGYKRVQPGDAVVAFSRATIFTIKKLIEASTGHKACVVYGALPPEMRRLQARLFNDPDSEYKVLVASDAVGMGLNLNIRRVIFHSLRKFDGSSGKEAAPVSVGQIKQIAGRAGRRNSAWGGTGIATCRLRSDVRALQAALELPQEQMSTPHAGLFPEFEHLEVFAGQMPEATFPEVLARFSEEARLDGTYFLCKQDDMIAVAKALEKVKGLSLADRFTFASSPTNARSRPAVAALLRFAKAYAAGVPAPLDLDFPHSVPATPDELRDLEEAYKVAAVWTWLAQRFGGELFPGIDEVRATTREMVHLMEQGLQELSEASAAELVQRQERRPRRQGAKQIAKEVPADVALSAEIPSGSGRSEAAARLQAVRQAPAQSSEAQQSAAVSGQTSTPSIGSTDDSIGGAGAVPVPVSLWRRVAGDNPPPQQLQRHRQRVPAPSLLKVFMEDTEPSCIWTSPKSAAPRRFVLADRRLGLPIGVLRAGAICTNVPTPYASHAASSAPSMIARAARRAGSSAEFASPAAQRAPAAVGEASSRDTHQLPWPAGTADDMGGSAHIREWLAPADSSQSGQQASEPWMPVPVHLHDARSTADSAGFTQRVAIYSATSMWGRARRWLANA